MKKAGKVLTVLLILALAVVLAGLFWLNRSAQAERRADLENEEALMLAEQEVAEAKALEEAQRAAEEEAAKKEAEEKAAQEAAQAEEEAKAKAEAEEKAKAEAEAAAQAAAEAAAAARAISIRGDNYLDVGEDASTGYPQILSQLLTENGKDITVLDNTWDMSGTLSQLAFAGIPEEKLNEYITKHKEKSAVGTALDYTDFKIRDDLDEVLRERDDLYAIHIIFMGFNGGWGRDLTELIEQIWMLHDTYKQLDKYLVVGYPPEIYADSAGYRAALEQEFGEHFLYISNSELSAIAMSPTGRAEMAQKIYDKLDSLGYLS